VLCERGIGRPALISLTHRLASLPSTEKVIIQAFLLSCRLSGYQYTFQTKERQNVLYTFSFVPLMVTFLCVGTEGAESGRWRSCEVVL
jgi:hypothetical protein